MGESYVQRTSYNEYVLSVYYLESKSDRFECYGVIIVLLFVVFKKVVNEPIVHFSIVVTGMLFLNYVADLEPAGAEAEADNKVVPTYLSFQLENTHSENVPIE